MNTWTWIASNMEIAALMLCCVSSKTRHIHMLPMVCTVLRTDQEPGPDPDRQSTRSKLISCKAPEAPGIFYDLPAQVYKAVLLSNTLGMHDVVCRCLSTTMLGFQGHWLGFSSCQQPAGMAASKALEKSLAVVPHAVQFTSCLLQHPRTPTASFVTLSMYAGLLQAAAKVLHTYMCRMFPVHPRIFTCMPCICTRL